MKKNRSTAQSKSRIAVKAAHTAAQALEEARQEQLKELGTVVVKEAVAAAIDSSKEYISKEFLGAFSAHEKLDVERDDNHIKRDEIADKQIKAIGETINDIYDSLPIHISQSVQRSIEQELPPAIKKEVNGKTEEMLNNVRWMKGIFAIAMPILLAVFGYIAVMTINNSQQLAGVEQALTGYVNQSHPK